MSQTAVLNDVSTAPQTGERSLLAGVALSSFSALLLELGLTRLFSVVLFYHFAFLAISIALLGLGAGGVFAYLMRERLATHLTRELVARLCNLNALAIPVVMVVAIRLPVSLELSTANMLRLTVIYLVSAVPFFLTGLEFSVVFAREHRHIPRLYGADLCGGAAACLAVVPLLNFLGGPNTLLFAALVSGVACVVWAQDRKLKRSAYGRMAILVVLIAVNFSGKLFDIVYAKGGFRDAAWVEFSRWNSISRVEVDRQGDAKAIVIDADASTYLMAADPQQWNSPAWKKQLMSAPPAIANVLRPHGAYAIIGPGGGVDVVRALAGGSPSVTGIEINPIIANTIMRGRYADYTYHLYQRPDVHLHVTDGRSFVRNAQQRFDVVQMTLVDTWASTAAGAFALSENSLYTVEAFEEYLEHLNPDGIIAITRWEFSEPREALRVVSVGMEALHRLGVADPRRNFIVVSEGDLDEDGIPVVVLTKRTAFTPEEEQAVRLHLAIYPALTPLYLPSQPQSNPFSQLIAQNDPTAFARTYTYNVAPVSDNAPFFFFTLKLGQIFNHDALQRGIDWKVNLGVAVLGMVLIISVIAVLAFLVIPLALGAGAQHRPGRLLYFVAVGIGYILVEIAFIQRFVLFLGHPTYALTVVVFLLLLSSGAGSLVSRRWLSDSKLFWLPLCAIIAAIVGYVFGLPQALNMLIGQVFFLKLLICGAMLIPLGFVMGMPFPTGLRSLASGVASSQDSNAIEWAWAMNAASSVLGSVLAMVIAIRFGLNATLACGAAAYALALLVTPTLKPRRG
jgi:hypothetical protein